MADRDIETTVDGLVDWRAQGRRDALNVADEAIRDMRTPPPVLVLPHRDWEAYWRGARAVRAQVAALGEEGRGK